MAAFASICAHTRTKTHTLSRTRLYCVKATYSLKVSNQQSWRRLRLLPSVFGIISLDCFAGDKVFAVGARRLPVGCTVVGRGAAPFGGFLLPPPPLLLDASPAFVRAFVVAVAVARSLLSASRLDRPSLSTPLCFLSVAPSSPLRVWALFCCRPPLPLSRLAAGGSRKMA